MSARFKELIKRLVKTPKITKAVTHELVLNITNRIKNIGKPIVAWQGILEHGIEVAVPGDAFSRVSIGVQYFPQAPIAHFSLIFKDDKGRVLDTWDSKSQKVIAIPAGLDFTINMLAPGIMSTVLVSLNVVE